MPQAAGGRYRALDKNRCGNDIGPVVLSLKTRALRYEDVPPDATACFTFREFDWPSFPFNWHYHPEVELTLIVRGRGVRFVGDSAEEFSDGDLCLLGANTPHCWASHKDAEAGVRSLVVQFRPDTWGEAFWKLPELRGIAKLLADARRGLEVRGAARREVEQLFVVLQQQPHGSLLRLDTLLEMLHCLAKSQELKPLAAAACEAPPGGETNGKLGKILGYIHAHLGPELTQCEVANAVRLSPAAFSQFFRRSLGTSYVHYVNELKIRNASRALIDTDQPITEIAYAAGFNNLSHFNAQFRRFRHLSPRAFRQQAQAAERTGVPAGAPGLVAPSGARSAAGERDLTVHGKGTVFEGVRVGTEEPRPWLRHYGVCPALARHGMVHVGIAGAHAPYQIVRTNQTTSYFLACFGGRGRVLVDGRWRTIRAGLACLLPTHVHNAFEALAGEAWQFAYVCYHEPPAQTPKSLASSPVVAEFNAELLRLAIQGLTTECQGRSSPAQADHWLELIQGYVQAFMHPSPKTSPLPALWQRVAARLQEPWTQDTLAREGECGSESLRRLCIRELGRSPLQHLVSLRMRRATELLATTRQPLGEVARAVGYAKPLIFSNAFKSNVGCRPSEYRKRAASQE
jgi:transcriptional regulator GlxA family with amidase domain/quercetin dioxygenase-like cupin family protein